MTTVLDALLNAQFNFSNVERMAPSLSQHPIYRLAKGQLDNAIEALENGCKAESAIQDSIGSELKLIPDAGKEP